jgi:putative ABC transport system permease protein
MHFVPILSTLRRHKIAASLIVLEIALTCAIVCNAVFLIGERLGRMHQDSGVPEDELVRVYLNPIGADKDAAVTTAADLDALRTIPGVKSVAVSDQVPFGDSSWTFSVSTKLDDDGPSSLDAAGYMGSKELLATLGAQLIAGREFTADEMIDISDIQHKRAGASAVIVTRAIAERLFPGQSAVGKQVYAWGKTPQIIVGIVDHLARPSENAGARDAACSLFFPVRMTSEQAGNYVLRVDPARAHAVLDAAPALLDRVNPDRILLERQTFDEVRRKHFEDDRAMALLLIGVCVALLVITALGIVGLASFWVQQRTRQIGIRRALGATRAQILGYFQTENFILATLGIVIGMGMAYGINQWLMSTYHVARLPAAFLPTGAIVLWLLGQIAVLGPALRAAAVPPAVATRTV